MALLYSAIYTANLTIGLIEAVSPPIFAHTHTKGVQTHGADANHPRNGPKKVPYDIHHPQ